MKRNLRHRGPPAGLATTYVSASTGDRISSSLLEAMACGLTPAVGRIPTGLPRVRDGEVDLLFSPGDARAPQRVRTDAEPSAGSSGGELCG